MHIAGLSNIHHIIVNQATCATSIQHHRDIIINAPSVFNLYPDRKALITLFIPYKCFVGLIVF